ncbi:MAG TPA: RNA polymerase sigma-54 factor [Planctomycetes bacterium]|nr:RNA polymerase sigma-54 factor [Planctomycetota bacterium]
MARYGMQQVPGQRMHQEMQLLPRMLQSLEVLQLPLGDLEAFLAEQALENEALEFVDAPCEPAPAPTSGRGDGEERTARFDAWLEGQSGPDPGLCGLLEQELAFLDLDPAKAAWARLLVSCLDERGYLSLSDEALLELGRQQGLEDDLGTLGSAIAILQGLGPAGIGGRDLVEVLLLQLDPEEEDYGLLCRIVEEFLDDIAKNKLPAVARALGVDVQHLTALLDRLRRLDPAPGASLAGESSPGLAPDIVVEEILEDAGERGGPDAPRRWRVRVEGGALPPVTVDSEVVRLARDRAQSADVRRYLRDKVQRARWLVEALEQRRATLLDVASWVFDRQSAFLIEGPAATVPLTMTACAEDLGVHTSTVSRAVAGKRVATPHGLFPLRRFFQSLVGENPEVGRDGLKAVLQRVVAAEDSTRPLSDDEIVEALAAEGHRLARRTVAKYRRELGIPSSYRRRKY